MFLYPDRAIGWARIYDKDVDTMFQRKYIDWDFKDMRGEYYSTVKLTDAGRERYIKDKENAKPVESQDGVFF